MDTENVQISWWRWRRCLSYYNRGGKGVKTLNITEKTGNLISINAVTDADDLMIINKSGLTIRMAVEDLRVMGRATQGVKLINKR
jgi:DNA gyrase subunit A